MRDRQSIDVQSFMIESRFYHHDPFEYEYRCTENEYDCPNELIVQPHLSVAALLEFATSTHQSLLLRG